MIAKSNGLGITQHSNIVKEYALKLFNKTITDETNKERFINVIKYSSLLHDIGKLTVNFQKFLKGKRKKPGYKFRHNEIGWAFLSKYLSEDFLTTKNREMVLNIVHWHHGISNKPNKHTDVEILSTLDEISINNMLNYLKEHLDNTYIETNPDLTYSEKAPLFYPDDKLLNISSNPILNVLRSIVITADRNSSNINDIKYITDDLIYSYLNMSESVKITNCKFDGTERFENQKKIVNSIEIGKPNIVKAPAGFGKTLMGVMWSFLSNRKIVWVLPKNDMAINLYYSILEEYKNLNISVSTQLVLSGEIIETNSSNLGLYETDVVITNIDNFLAPNYKNDIMDSSGLLFSADVIFDEYHDLISDSPYFSLFINIMKGRGFFTNSTTLLLSATPTNVHKLWENKLIPSSITNVLPNNNTHFKPVHNKPYVVNMHTEKVVPKPNTNTLVIKNTVKSAQIEKQTNDYDLLLHSKFTNEHKKIRYNKIMSNYGKTSEVTTNKPNIIGTHILQASFDISFNRLIEDILSPESTLQRFGRVNRWGEFEITTVDIIKEINSKTNRSEVSIKNLLYSRNLSDSWFDYLVDNIKGKKTITLTELYNFYNKYYYENGDVLYKHFNLQLNESNKHLSKIYPIKFNQKKEKSDNKTAGSNKLRSTSSEVFYIVEHEHSKDWIGPFTTQIYRGFEETFNEQGDMVRNMIKTMKLLRNNDDDRFEYNDIIDDKRINLDKIRKYAVKSKTPYISYNLFYNDELGILK